MKIESVRRIMETTSFDTANQYLRFGWKLVSQHAVEPAPGEPVRMNYVLVSVRTLEDTRRILELADNETANRYLELGWRLVDKYVTSLDDAQRRQETLHYVLAWQEEGEPPQPTGQSLAERADELFPDESLTPDDEILPEDSKEGPLG
jgi:hypothetical protein